MSVSSVLVFALRLALPSSRGSHSHSTFAHTPLSANAEVSWDPTFQGVLKEKGWAGDCFVSYLPPLSSDHQNLLLTLGVPNSVYFVLNIKGRNHGEGEGDA